MWKIFIIGFFLLLNARFSFSQIIEKEYDDTENIITHKSEEDKIDVFIFLKAGNTNRITNRLENNLNTLEVLGRIDFKHFNIYRFIITTHDSVCSLKSLNLNGYDMTSKFIIDPYFILVESGKVYDELAKSKLDSISKTTVKVAPNRNSKNSPFLIFNDDKVLTTFIGKSEEAAAIEKLRDEMKLMDSEINEMDSVISEMNKPKGLKALFNRWFGSKKKQKN